MLLFTLSIFSYAQSKYFNTFTLINNRNGTSMKDDVRITMNEEYLNMSSNYFNFNNAKKQVKTKCIMIQKKVT